MKQSSSAEFSVPVDNKQGNSEAAAYFRCSICRCNVTCSRSLLCSSCLSPVSFVLSPRHSTFSPMQKSEGNKALSPHNSVIDMITRGQLSTWKHDVARNYDHKPYHTLSLMTVTKKRGLCVRKEERVERERERVCMCELWVCVCARGSRTKWFD